MLIILCHMTKVILQIYEQFSETDLSFFFLYMDGDVFKVMVQVCDISQPYRKLHNQKNSIRIPFPLYNDKNEDF